MKPVSVSAMVAVVLVLLLSAVGVAEAGNISTPIMVMSGGTTDLECKAVNVGTAPISVTITFYDASNGSVLGTPLTQTVNPNRSLGKVVDGATLLGDYFCKFTTGTVNNIRVAIARFDPATGTYVFGWGNVK